MRRTPTQHITWERLRWEICYRWTPAPQMWHGWWRESLWEWRVSRLSLPALLQSNTHETAVTHFFFSSCEMSHNNICVPSKGRFLLLRHSSPKKEIFCHHLFTCPLVISEMSVCVRGQPDQSWPGHRSLTTDVCSLSHASRPPLHFWILIELSIHHCCCLLLRGKSKVMVRQGIFKADLVSVTYQSVRKGVVWNSKHL